MNHRPDSDVPDSRFRTSRAVLVCLALMCLTLRFQVHAVQRWERTYGGPDDDGGASAEQTRDGGYIIGGYSRTLGITNNMLWLVKTDSQGNVIWSKGYRPSSAASSGASAVDETQDGGFVAAGHTWYNGPTTEMRAYVVRTNAQGDSLWTREFGAPSAQATDIRVLDDGGCIVAGWIADSRVRPEDIFILRLDSSGETIWSKRYGDVLSDEAFCIIPLPQGGFLVAGAITMPPNEDWQACLMRLDTLGDTVWVRRYRCDHVGYSTCFYGVAAVPGGGYIAAGSTTDNWPGDFFLVRTDSLGDTLWTRTYGGVAPDCCMGIDVADDGGFVLAGQTQSYGAGESDVWLVKVDPYGQRQWMWTYGGLDWDSGESVRETKDGGYVICGYTTSFSTYNRMYLIKTDAFGSSTIIESPRPEASSRDCLKIYETPNHRLRYYLPEPGRVELEVLDAVGRRQSASDEGRKSIGWHEARLRADGPAGVSFVRLKADCGQAVVKVISLPR